MGLNEVQEVSSVFHSADDVLCVGVDARDLDFLRSIGVETVVFDPMNAGSFDTKYNVLVVGRLMSLFGLFSFIEKNMGLLLPNSRIVVRVDESSGLSDAKNVVAELAKPLMLQPEMYVEDSSGLVWLYLSRVR